MTIVFKVSDNIKEKMIEYYKDCRRPNTPPYAIFQATEADTIITLYESGKVMFQGISADIDANIWVDLEKKLNNRVIDINSDKKEKEKYKEELNYYYSMSTIGSDEVGTGDYFGPIIVTASFVDKSKIDLMNELGVKDSKKLTDEKILKIAPTLIKEIPYVTFTLKNSSTTKSVNVKLVWSSVTNTFEDKDDLVFTLKSSANTSTNLVNETKFPTAVADIANNITLAPSANVTYTLTVTYKNNSSKNQNTDMGKAFSGTITVKPAS